MPTLEEMYRLKYKNGHVAPISEKDLDSINDLTLDELEEFQLKITADHEILKGQVRKGTIYRTNSSEYLIIKVETIFENYRRTDWAIVAKEWAADGSKFAKDIPETKKYLKLYE